MKNEFDKREIVISKLKKIITSGHTPSRSHNTYGIIPSFSSNCFIHACFNLTDEQLQSFNGNEMFEIMKHINGSKPSTDKEIKNNLFSVVKATGLNIESTEKDYSCNNNQWVVAFYLGARKYSLEPGKRPVYEDYHFMLKEKSGEWSEKQGTSTEINIIDNPPISYKSNENVYLLQGFYLITNPYAELIKNKNINEIEENTL
jgi:hypothetical protein